MNDKTLVYYNTDKLLTLTSEELKGLENDQLKHFLRRTRYVYSLIADLWIWRKRFDLLMLDQDWKKMQYDLEKEKENMNNIISILRERGQKIPNPKWKFIDEEYKKYRFLETLARKKLKEKFNETEISFCEYMINPPVIYASGEKSGYYFHYDNRNDELHFMDKGRKMKEWKESAGFIADEMYKIIQKYQRNKKRNEKCSVEHQ